MMKILVVDDEPLARLRLTNLVNDIEGFFVIAEAENGDLAIQQYKKHQPDIILLDIEMPGKDGLETASWFKNLPQAPAIIFTTAYDEHALQAFQSGGQAYLLKPINRHQLFESLSQVSVPNKAQLATFHDKNKNLDNAQHLFITVSYRGDLIRVPIDEIDFFKAEQKYVIIRHHDSELLTEESLKSLESQFSHSFIRIHRNALVAKTAITQLKKHKSGHYSVYLEQSQTEIEVSRRHVAAVRKLVKGE